MLSITADGTYTITMTTSGATTTTDSIGVSSGVTANITLDGVSIDRSATSNAFAFTVSSATVNLTLVGANTLKSGSYGAGLQAPAGTILTIDGSGNLEATGGNQGAGIGGGYNQASGTITIGGTAQVTATGGYGSAGIGGGRYGAGGTITITDAAQVTATGSSYAAGIGSGGSDTTPLNAGTITIDTTGTVTASGGATSGTSGIGAPIGQGGFDGGDGAGLDDDWATNPSNQTVAAGTAVTFSALAETVGTSPPDALDYQWQVSTDNGATWANITGETGTDYTISSVTTALNGNLYRALVTATDGDLAGTDSIVYRSEPATLTVRGGGTPLTSTVSVPALNPAMLLLLALGVAGLAGWRRRV